MNIKTTQIIQTIPNVIYDHKAVCFHISYPSRHNPDHIGMTIGEIMKFPILEREWSFGLDEVDEVVEILNGESCRMTRNTFVEIERRGELNKISRNVMFLD